MDFLMVFMASGIACGRGRTVAAADWRKMAAILQICRLTETCSLGLLFDLGHPYYDQLWSINNSQNEVSTDQHHATISQLQV